MATASKGGRPAITRSRFAQLSRLAEHVSKRVPHIMEMESGEAYLAFCRALKDSIDERFGGSLENLFILETYRRMLPYYEEFEPWHNSQRKKAKGAPSGAGLEFISVCKCGHFREVHRGAFAGCTHKSGCGCTSYRQVTRAYGRISPATSASDEGALW